MSRYPQQITPPVIKGETLMPIEQFAKLSGISISRIYERVSTTRKHRRGALIPAYKEQGRLWFSRKALSLVRRVKSYATMSHVQQVSNQQTPDMSWL